MFKTALVGLGPHGRRLLKVASGLKLKVVALIDQNTRVLEDIDMDSSVKFSSVEQAILSHPDIQLLIIATNAPSHASIAIRGMKAGIKYVLVEKPMACSIAECDEMLFTARKMGVRLAVDKMNRFDPFYGFIKEGIKTNRWGKLKSIYIQKPGIGLGNLGTHSFDICNFFCDEFPARVTAWLDEPLGRNPRGEQFVDPGGLVVLEYPSGVRATISQIEDGAGPQSMEINFTGARILHDPKSNFADIRVRDLSVKPGPGRPAVYNTLPVEGVNLQGDMLKQMEELIVDLTEGDNCRANAIFGKSAVEILVAAYKSNAIGNIPVNLPLVEKEDLHLYLKVT